MSGAESPSSATAVKNLSDTVNVTLHVCPKEMPVECCQATVIEASGLALWG